MKKEIKTWLLYYYIIVHVLAVFGTTGISMYLSLIHPGIWNWFFLFFISWFNYFIFDSMFSLVRRIRRRRNL